MWLVKFVLWISVLILFFVLIWLSWNVAVKVWLVGLSNLESCNWCVWRLRWCSVFGMILIGRMWILSWCVMCSCLVIVLYRLLEFMCSLLDRVFVNVFRLGKWLCYCLILWWMGLIGLFVIGVVFVVLLLNSCVNVLVLLGVVDSYFLILVCLIFRLVNIGLVSWCWIVLILFFGVVLFSCCGLKLYCLVMCSRIGVVSGCWLCLMRFR